MAWAYPCWQNANHPVQTVAVTAEARVSGPGIVRESVPQDRFQRRGIRRSSGGPRIPLWSEIGRGREIRTISARQGWGAFHLGGRGKSPTRSGQTRERGAFCTAVV